MNQQRTIHTSAKSFSEIVSRLGPVGRLLLDWGHPLQISRRSLRKAIKDRAHYARGQLLDVGCGDKPYRDCFNHIRAYIGIDVLPNARVDLVADALHLPFREGTFDTVLCNEVLEHVPEPASLMSEAFRVLKPGGYLLLSAPQTWGLHREPRDYYRYTVYGLRYLGEKAGFQVAEISPTCGLWATIAQRIADTFIWTYAVNAPRLILILLSIVLSPALLLASALDAVVGKRGDTLDNILVALRPK